MRFYHILLILLFTAVTMCAQTTPWEELAESSKEYLEAHPDDIKERLNLGYYYMMSNQPLLALREYRYITNRDSTNVDAWVGVIWAYNGMRQYKLALSVSKEQINLHPEHAPFYNLRANAYLKLGDYTSARYYYSRALDYAPFDLNARRTAYEGLGWAYHYMDDYTGARKYFVRARILASPSESVHGIEVTERNDWQTEFSWTHPYKGANVYYAAQSYAYASWGLKASFEEFQRDSRHYRSAFQFQAHKQFGSIRSRAIANYLTGIDDETYPAMGLGISNNIPLYIRTAAVTPFHRFHFMHYPWFNTYQNDIGIAIIYRKIDTGYQYTNIYQDSDAIDSDRNWEQHHLWLSYPLLHQIRLGIYSGWGEQSWWITPAGSVSDTNSGIDSYYGIDLMFPVAGSIYAGIYNQMGNRDQTWEYLVKARLILYY